MAAMVCANSSFATITPKEKKQKNAVEKPLYPEWLKPDSVAYSNLGRHLSNILINATKVRAYSLLPKEKITLDDVEIESHFVRDTLLYELNKDQMIVLKYSLISCGANYHTDSAFIPLLPYCPVIEFEFINKKEVAHVFISLSDFKWGLRYDGKTQFKFNYGDGIFVHRFCDYFLSMNKKHKK